MIRLIIVFSMGLIAVTAEAETVLHLKKVVYSDQQHVSIHRIIEEKIHADSSGLLRIRTFCSNEQAAALLREAGLKDFILVGEGVWIMPHPETNAPGPDMVSGRPLSVPPETYEPEFYIRNIIRNTGEVVYRKGMIEIAAPVLIRSRSPDGTCMVQNISGGRFYRVSGKIDAR